MKNHLTEIERLKAENEIQKDWISLATHDFKEAFGSLLWVIEIFESGAMSSEDFFKLLPQIKQDTKKNLQTITNTSEWIRTQMKGFEPKKSKIPVLDLYIQLRKEFEVKLGDKNIDFQFKGDEALVFQNDEYLILFILKKLLDNAIKYSYPNKAIQFEAVETENSINLSITDHGMGMTKANSDLLFTFQGPVFIGTKGEIGAGLSLHIAKKFVLLLHGKIEVDSTENVGTKATIYLPPN